ncbi:MAG: hypothetical protein WC994_04860 [Brumimicrobium sp.]
MQKTKAILYSLLTLTPFVVLAFVLYNIVPSTPMLIIILLILMAGVILGYYVYSKNKNEIDNKSNNTKNIQFPDREKNLLKVYPKAFCDKLEKYTGSLYLLGIDKPFDNITIVDGRYNALKDELTLKYTNGIRTIITGVKSIAVGYNQFVIYEYDEISIIKNRERISFRHFRNSLVQLEVKDSIEVKAKMSLPLYMFVWEN